MKQQTSGVTGQLLSELEWEKQICQCLLTSSFILGASFYFILGKLQHLSINKKVFQIELNFSQHPRIFLESFPISSINNSDEYQHCIHFTCQSEEQWKCSVLRRKKRIIICWSHWISKRMQADLRLWNRADPGKQRSSTPKKIYSKRPLLNQRAKINPSILDKGPISPTLCLPPLPG